MPRRKRRRRGRSNKPIRRYLPRRARRKALEILRDEFWIHSIYGANVYLDEEEKTYTSDESPNKICIFVLPSKHKELEEKIYHYEDLTPYTEFDGTGIESACAALLAWIAVRGWIAVNPGWELEHLDHHHQCINPNHHRWVPKSLNQHRKKCKKPPHKHKDRDDKGRWVKSQNPDGKPKTHVPLEEVREWCDCTEMCIYNLIQSTPADWAIPGKRDEYRKLVKNSCFKIRMRSLW